MLYYTHEKNGGVNMEKKMDRRALRTRKNITDAFVQLLEEKRFDKITVAEIAEMADINRRTFYLHYVDIFALLDELENKLIIELQDDFDNKPAEDLYSFQVQFLEFMNHHPSLIKALLASPESEFLSKVMRIATEAHLIHREYDTDIERKYCWNYIEHGMKGVLLDWITNDSLPLTKMASFTTKLVQNSLSTVAAG